MIPALRNPSKDQATNSAMVISSLSAGMTDTQFRRLGTTHARAEGNYSPWLGQMADLIRETRLEHRKKARLATQISNPATLTTKSASFARSIADLAGVEKVKSRHLR